MTRQRLHQVVVFVALCAAACSDSTASNAPAPALVERVSVPGRPYSVAVASTGASYISQLDLAQLTRVNLPASAVAASVNVGAVPTEVAFSSTGSTAFVTNQFDHAVGVIDVGTNAQTSTFSVTGDPFDILVGPGDSLLYVTTNANALFVIRIADHSVVTTLPTSGATANGLAIQGSSLFVSTRAGGTVIQYNLTSYQVVRTFAIGGRPQGIVVSPNGQQLFVANEDSSLRFFNVANGVPQGSVNLGGRGFGLALNPANGYLYATTIEAGRVQVVNPSNQMIVATLSPGGVARRVAFTPSGSISIVANEGGWVDLIH